MKISLHEIMTAMQCIAPLETAEPWDNVGLLLGSPDASIHRLMTCLTLTAEAIQEAVAKRAEAVIVHHPLPFKPLNRLVTTQPAGAALWQLAQAGIAVYSPHTAWDNAHHGINHQLAGFLGLQEVVPLGNGDRLPRDVHRLASIQTQLSGVGRLGRLPKPLLLAEITVQLKNQLPGVRPLANLPSPARHQRVAIVCGSGGSLVELVAKSGADLMITGEATYHQALEAQAVVLTRLVIGHYASERFAMDWLAQELQRRFPQLDIWASEHERDAFFDVLTE
jgi:dinuclear metal center YbgI/SA1388 family protein